jgi:hypothetical protein
MTEVAAGGIRELAWLVPLLPISAFFLIVFFGKKTPGKGAPIGIIAVGSALAVGLLSFFEAITKHDVVETSSRSRSRGSRSAPCTWSWASASTRSPR